MRDIILLADSGSTKTHWVLIQNGQAIQDFKGQGINPYVHTEEEILNTILEARSEMNEDVSEVHFYGAGCSSEAMIRKVNDQFLGAEFSNVEVSHDLLAASRSLFGNGSGIACILGTGSNSALYDGKDIVDNLPALGYVLDDVGGGVDLGKRLLKAIYKRRAPQSVINQFMELYELSVPQVLHNVHFEDSPNRFIASFALFVKDNLENDFIHSLVKEAFTEFFESNIRPYQNSDNEMVGFIGSIAYNFSDVLEEVLSENEYQLGKVVKEPMPGLVEYHNANLS